MGPGAFRRLRLAAVTALALGAALCAPAATAGAEVPGSGGVVIDGKLLPPERIWDEYRYQYCVKTMIHARPSDVVDEQVLERVVQQVVNAELLVREAARRGFALSEADRAALRAAEVKRWGTEANLRTACVLLKVDEPFLLARAARNGVVERMVEKESGAEQGITEAALRDWHRDNPGRYLPSAPPPPRYLFVPVSAGNLAEIYAKIATEADALRTANKSFASVVAAWSQHESAARGGVVPETGGGGPPLPFQPPAGQPQECRFTNIRTDPAGLHLYFRDCRQPLPYEQVRERVRTDLIQDRRGQWLKALSEKLRTTARLEYRVGPPTPAPAGGGGSHGKQAPVNRSAP